MDPPGYALHLFSRKTPTQVECRITNTAIHNFSSKVLTFTERQLLGLGLHYIPRPIPPSISTLHLEYDNFARRLRLRHHFNDDGKDKFSPWRIPNPNWNLEELFKPLEDAIQIGEDILNRRINSVPHQVKSSLPRHLRIALNKLRKDTNIVIKSADKNLGLVILDKIWYLKEATTLK